MFGNGLRPQIWTKFVERFNIPNIAEFCKLISKQTFDASSFWYGFFFLVEPFYKVVFLKQKERKKRMPNSFGFWISINSGCERQSVLRLVVDKITVSSKLRNDTDCLLPHLG